MHVPDKISTLCAAAYTYVKNIKDNRNKYLMMAICQLHSMHLYKDLKSYQKQLSCKTICGFKKVVAKKT